jgi:hypothetical protein
MSTFTCARCGEDFTTPEGWTEADSNREYLRSGQDHIPGGVSRVCEDCYAIIMGRARADGLLP